MGRSTISYKDYGGKRAINCLILSASNRVSRVIVTRDGLYGNVTMAISSGYPEDMYAGFTKGRAKPSVTSLTFGGNDRELEFSIQVRHRLRECLQLKDVVKELICYGSLHRDQHLRYSFTANNLRFHIS